MGIGETNRCDVVQSATDVIDRNISITPQSARRRLSSNQISDYENYRAKFLSWLLKVGKNPDEARGYSPYTVYVDSYRTAAFDLWVWESNGGYMIPPSETDAQNYFEEEVAFDDVSRSTKGKIQEALEHYNRWLTHEFGSSEWSFQYSFDSSGGDDSVADYLRRDERRAVRQAALDYGNDSWKFTSLVWSGLDAGLRPVEVLRAKTNWIDRDNHVIRIPKSDSAKNEGFWETSVTDRTHHALLNWLEEREKYLKYDDTDTLWLTRRGNPYGSKELGRLLRRLCKQVGIDTENRKLPWYSLRHSVGTLMTEERDLQATKDQLRHKSAKTTMKYDGVSTEKREEVLNKIG